MSRRKRGERNWGDEAPYQLHTTPPHRERPPYTRLVVEPLGSQYEVHDHHGNVWVVVVAADGVLEIIDEPEVSYYNMATRVKKAVARYKMEHE